MNFARQTHLTAFLKSFRKVIVCIVSLDLRSLALLRILIGSLLIVNLYVRAQDLVAHYTDFGLLPRSDLLARQSNEWFISIHLLNGSWQIQALLFLIAGFFALLLILGYRTKLATFISWFLLMSLQYRNPMILSGADQVFRLVLFFAIFLPWGIRFSLDSIRSTTKSSISNSFSSFGTFAYIFQIGSLYVFSAFHKSGSEWRVEGSAIYYAINIGNFETRIGNFMSQFQQVLKLETLMVFWIEAVAPFLLLLPIFMGPIRTLIVVIFIGLHIGMGIHLRLGFFPWICAFAWCGLLPGWFWDSLLHKLKIAVLFNLFLTNINFWYHKLFKSNRISAAMTQLISNNYDLNTDIKFYKSIMVMCLITYTVFFILLWNISNITRNTKLIPRSIIWTGNVLYITQNWSMFAPSPPKEGWWYVIPAVLKSGKQIDLYTEGKEITWEEPELISKTYKNAYWEKFLNNIAFSKGKPYIEPYANYLCRKWNKTHFGNKKVESFYIFIIKQNTLADNKHSPAYPVLLHEKHCD